PGARFLVTVSVEGARTENPQMTVRVWNTATGTESAPAVTLKGHDPHAYPAADGVRFALSGGAGELVRVLAADGRPAIVVPDPSGHHGSATHVAFSPDGARIAPAGYDPAATRVWNATDGAPVSPPLAHLKTVRWVAFDPTGERVVTGSDDNTARIWNAITGE